MSFLVCQTATQAKTPRRTAPVRQRTVWRKNLPHSSLGNLVSDFTTLGAKVYQTLTAGNNAGNGGADAVSSYRSQESYYNTFVYQEDTALPASLKTLFQKELGERRKP